MTTQREVIEAFASFEESPRRASNFRLVKSDEVAQRAYLVGGRHAVYAKREPLSRIIVYPQWYRDYYYRPNLAITTQAMQNQARRVKRRLLGNSYREGWESRSNSNVEIVESDETPTVDDFDDLTNY